MIKESIFSFLKIRKMPIIIFTGIVVIFGILFYLYDIPFDAIIYGCELSFVWCAVCLFIDFYKYYKRHKLLHINREQFFDDAEQLPEHMDIIEYDYQELAKELYQAKQELISKNRIAKKELLDYYGMWVHQIKTPIAALDILLQNTEQFLYEEDIVNSRINKRLEIIQESIPVSDMKMELFKIEQYVEMALNYLRVEDISSDLSFKQYAVDDMVRQVIRKYAKIFISKKIKMNFKPTGRYIVTDDKWFVFVLEQFISNALKYTKKGQISIYMKEKSLVIEDTGIGIPAEVLLYHRNHKRTHKKSDTEALKNKKVIQLNSISYKVVDELDRLAIAKADTTSFIDGWYVVVKDSSIITSYLKDIYENSNIYDELKEYYGKIQYSYSFNLNGSRANRAKTEKSIQKQLQKKFANCSIESRELSRESFYELYGGFLFIGIFLGIIFLMATTLIIYYKQISEGYDDRERYQIMQKVGMSKKEVRHSIRSQVLLVFFLPLIMAVIHLAFAFKIITKLLSVLNLTNISLFFMYTVGTVAVFAVIYAIIYSITAREYYKIIICRGE